MGCDIHLHVEIRDDDQWTEIEHPSAVGIGELDSFWRGHPDYGNRWWRSRNYDMFAMLAGVRNGRAFAGFETGTGFVPIAEPKGLPADVSESVEKESDSWGVDGHSHSWITVGEWLRYDLTQTTKHAVWVADREDYAGAKAPAEGRFAEADRLAAEGRNIYDRLIADMVPFAAEDGLLGWRKYYNVDPYYETVSPAFMTMIQGLYRVAVERGLSVDDVRLVFWFDN